MQSLNWNDLKYFLALHRAETLAGAARLMKVSDTTVARRLAVLENVLGATLFIRSDTGRHVLTAAGEALLTRAEKIEREGRSIEEALGQQEAWLIAVVRISAVPFMINKMLIPALPALHARHPDITIELVPDSRNLDLTKRAADLALRFSQPVVGGLKVRAVKLAEIGFGVFAPAGWTSSQPEPWITYDDTLSSLPQAQWLARVVGQRGETAAKVRVTDAETALEAVASGLGQTLLPLTVGAMDARVRLVEPDGVPPLPKRDIWLLSHTDEAAREAIVAVKAWLSDVAW